MNRRRTFIGGAAIAASSTVLTSVIVHADEAAAHRPPSGVLPSAHDITDVLHRVADHWIGARPDPGDNKWANATFFSGLMALHALTYDPRYLRYARGWAEKHHYGLNAGSVTRHADNQCAGQAYLDLHAIDPDEEKIAAIESCLRWMTYDDRPGKDDDWWWVDALHMAMPPFARLSVLREDPRYAEKLYRLYQHTKRTEGGPGLYDRSTGLWYRDRRFLPGHRLSLSGVPVFWSRGNGWAAAGHVKTLKALPPDAPHIGEYRDTLALLLKTVAERQRPDGFWNVNLGDPERLSGPESSGTAFFVYALAYALRTGLVDRATYLPVAARAWNGLVGTAVRRDGFLGYVQGVGDRPESSAPVTEGSAAGFGVGAFLLAGTELAALARGVTVR
ncbi:glycoside hydrolase family 88 protein [Streptomyces sp. HD1123-B1]|uniref:glycoside hydrolase family 88/105 protein n=1 Tax=Streptomyces huangiella TaxID=3228804 RepID=UPI003D7D9C1B